MKRILFIAMIAALAISPSMAQETCASKAFDKNGRQLAGAALNSFLKKCKREACEPKAVSANGKKLFGAAKNSFMKKCERNAGIVQPSTILRQGRLVPITSILGTNPESSQALRVAVTWHPQS